MFAFIRVAILITSLVPGLAYAQLAPEPIPNRLTLAPDYPKQWVFVHDVNFPTLLAGKVVIVDPSAATRQVKGSIGAAQAASFVESHSRPELYVAETFYSRGIEGERTDVLTIYDKASLDKTGEVVLPGGKRGQFITQRGSFRLTGNERFALVFNFTPASSVTVVDLNERRVAAEISIPGCSLVYPTGEQGFATLCGNGTLASFVLDDSGAVSERDISAPFNDIDNDAMFMKSAKVGGVEYFPTYTGNVRPIDTSGRIAQVQDAWPLVSDEERVHNWRPGGWQVVTTDGAGRLYVLMHENGKDGSHEDGGGEIWVFDANTHERVDRIALKAWGISIEATHTSPSYLVVVNAEMELDVYDAGTGEWLRRIGGGLAATPFALFAVK